MFEMSTIGQVILVYIFVFFVLLALFTQLTKPVGRLLVSFIVAGMVTFLTLVIINQNPVFLDEETAALKLIDGALKRTVDSDSLFAQEQILLIDVAAHSQLIPSPQPLFNDTTAKASIVDHQKLANLFHWIILDSVNRYIDVLVNDVLLEDKTAADSSIRNSLVRLTSQKKIVQAQRITRHASAEGTTFDLSGIPSYSVDINEKDGIYFSHALLDSVGRPSLPYMLYLNRQKLAPPVEIRARLFKQRLSPMNNKEAWVGNWFIPDLILTEEAITGKSLAAPSSFLERILSWSADFFFGSRLTASAGVARFLPIGLGAACQQEGQRELMEQFRLAKKSGQRVTVLIGSFTDDKDLHQTVYGPMHGGLILLNVYFNLVAQRHVLSYGYLFFLWVGYWFILWLLLFLRLPADKASKNRIETLEKTYLKKWVKWVKRKPKPVRVPIYFIYFTVREIGFNQLHYWLLLALLISVAICFGHVVNVMGLTIFLAAMDFGLRGLREDMSSKTNVN